MFIWSIVSTVICLARGWLDVKADCSASANAKDGLACWFARIAFPCAVCAANASWSARGAVNERLISWNIVSRSLGEARPLKPSSVSPMIGETLAIVPASTLRRSIALNRPRPVTDDDTTWEAVRAGTKS